MNFFKSQSLNRKIVFLTILILALGFSWRFFTNQTNKSDVKGIQSEKQESIKFMPLEKNNTVKNLEFISLEEYETILEKAKIKELYVETDPKFDKKVNNIEKYMSRRNSPLGEKAWYIVAMANKFQIDYRLVPAISIIESSGGKKLYRPYNAWGWGGASGITFSSWEHSIYVVTKGIAEGYYARGANTPRKIAPAYNPHTPDEWGAKVDMTMNQIGHQL